KLLTMRKVIHFQRLIGRRLPGQRFDRILVDPYLPITMIPATAFNKDFQYFASNQQFYDKIHIIYILLPNAKSPTRQQTHPMETDSGTSSTFLPSTVCSSTSTLTTQTPAVTTTPTNADFEEPLQARFLVLERKLWELEVNAERDVGSSIDVGELDNMQNMQRRASDVRSVEDTEFDGEDESVIETVIEWAYERDNEKEDDEEE
ncbi:9761_t:CDS:2, partial [Paraglomus occultum]